MCVCVCVCVCVYRERESHLRNSEIKKTVGHNIELYIMPQQYYLHVNKLTYKELRWHVNIQCARGHGYMANIHSRLD